MLEAEELERPHRNRRRHQQALARKHRRRQLRRRRRANRIRMWRAVNSLQFWTRALIGFVCVAFLAFWAKFAIVYDIPLDVQKGHLYGVQAFVAEKTWWFGPLAFNLGYQAAEEDPTLVTMDPVTGLIQSLGAYQTIMENPKMIWIDRSGTGQ